MSKIVFKDVMKIYPGNEKNAVNNVNLEVNSGEFIVFLGTSGCGKTTLLKMTNRLYAQTKGQIIIDDTDTRELPVNELRRKIGYVIQQSGLFPHMTVEKNIAVVPDMLGWDKKKIAQRIEELLELVHLDPKVYRSRYPRQLSGGEQQRIGLARALAADPPIMLMDEPFGAIDAITRTKLQDELIHIQKKLHKTILFVTHDVDEALRLADKIVIMKDGDIVQFDTPLNIIAKPKNDFVRDLIGGDDIIRQISLINISDAMQKVTETITVDSTLTISDTSDLKSALAAMLKSRTEQLYVVDERTQVIGIINFAQIQALLSPNKKEKHALEVH
ncbi:ABC transporter ATP-binding protein [Paenisporosarcina antarctica]|uniref:Quaternary amine transport ATP-binding protein n=1 Tax=Paenisporosarcina antarctica TaxID=417367 RepID=A0A4P6ZUZ4_9BACL|nr:ABC transporter ATP-binding protein [Paenisporosarcina antarctica]QBP40222.1 ABC transporter ATP-binding protein [Paenisporosarcina antarctica]